MLFIYIVWMSDIFIFLFILLLIGFSFWFYCVFGRTRGSGPLKTYNLDRAGHLQPTR